LRTCEQSDHEDEAGCESTVKGMLSNQKHDHKRILDHRRISDMERRIWTEVQSKFHDSQLQKLNPEDQEHIPSSTNHQESLPSTDSVQKGYNTKSDGETQVAAKPPTVGQPTLINLRQFAHHGGSGVQPRRISSVSSIKSRDRINSASLPSREDCDVRLSSSSIDQDSIGPITQPKPEGLDCDKFEDSSHANAFDEASMIDENETRPKRNVVWEAFRGTEAVCRSALRQRLYNRQQKDCIDALRQTPIKSSDDGEEDEPSQKEHGATSMSPSVFREMEIIGQFNLGFIIAKDPENNLWVLDQHAVSKKFSKSTCL
jgi:DNA mismatch repair ATPase MutL